MYFFSFCSAIIVYIKLNTCIFKLSDIVLQFFRFFNPVHYLSSDFSIGPTILHLVCNLEDRAAHSSSRSQEEQQQSISNLFQFIKFSYF
jgi:hypothetical protein